MRKTTAWLLTLGVALLLTGPAHAVSITVDGNPTDWLPAGALATIDGLSKPGTAANNYAFAPVSTAIHYTVEDGPGWQVTPGYGGQDFDVEAVYGFYEGNGVYAGVFTGFDPTGEGGGLGEYVGPLYRPGDLFFDFGSDGVWDLAIEVYGTGTIGHAYGKTSGTWWLTPTYSSSRPSEINYGTAGLTDYTAAYGGGTSFAYSDRDSSDHNFIEACLDQAFLDWGATTYGWDLTGTINIHWTESCGNDVGDLTVPEPATMVMLGCLGAGMFFARRHRKA